MKGEQLRLKRWDPIDLIAKYDKRRNVLVHVGAHQGEEAEQYLGLGFSTTLWVEPQPNAFKKLENLVGEKYCLQAAIWDESGIEMDFNRTTNSVSSSFFKPAPDTFWKDEVKILDSFRIKTSTLSDVIAHFQELEVLGNRFGLRLDVQGAEFRILKSSLHLLSRIDFICCEVTRHKSAYVGAEPRRKVVQLLWKSKWVPLFNRINPVNSHGETIFVPLSKFTNFWKPFLYMRLVSIIDHSKYHLRRRFFPLN